MLTTIHARADFYTQSEQAARQLHRPDLDLPRRLPRHPGQHRLGPGDADVKTVFDSIHVSQKGDRAEITATIPPSFLRKLVSQPAHDAVQGEPAPSAPNKK